MAIPPRVYQICVGIFASLGSFLYGYDLGVIGGSVAAAAFEKNFNNPSDEIDGAIVAVFTGGGFFGAALAGLVSDMIGRRLTILLGAAIFLVGGALQTAGRDISYLLAGRAIAGLGVGDLVMIVPLYQAEIAHPAIRGRITALQQLLIGFGSMIASFTTYGTNQNMTADNNAQWRIPLGIQLAPAFLLACLILLFPESPRWQIAHGRTQKGLATLARLHASGNQDDEWVLAEYSQIEATIEQERAESASWMDLFKEKASFRRLFLVLALQASVQMTGVSAIQYFTPQIYASLNIGTTESLQYQAVSNVLAIVAQFCTAVFIDRIGRRWPLILGNVFNGIFWIVLTAVVAVFPSQPQSAQEGLGWVFIVMNWLFQLSFSFTCGSLSWIIPAEVFDMKTRSKGVTLGVMMSFAFNTLIGQVTAPAFSDVSWRYFITFVVCNFTNALFFWALMPETKKRPLEEMNALFSETQWFIPTAKTRNLGFHIEEFAGDIHAQRAKSVEHEHDEKIDDRDQTAAMVK
ncbi:sugar transporter STL1 [Hortaea werneckii]|nr:sugar transporter STL1 [Hortaea werneckii]KAI6987034.1 sugar transporter STL1 [Hortaea werneckii]KAI7081066.1 sugar transporter STL1 [Hortaea werneckii]KAI7141226.1 sugar transporter STL1 [Hortaea werneckii]KAI7167920.1 sugar transporter STL1 [Hortaea werneckii]